MSADGQTPSVLSLLLQTELNMTTVELPPTLTPTTPPARLPCDPIQYDYEVPMAVVCAVGLVFGIVFTFFGYRCFKAIMFLVGFLLASVIVVLVCLEESTLEPGVSVGVALGVGVVCGLATMLFRLCGLFAAGFQLGVVLSAAALLVLEQFHHPDLVWLPLGVAFGLGVLGGLLTLKWQRRMVVVSTAVTGGAVLAVCADYFLELFRMAEYVYDRFCARASVGLCWYSWLVVGAWPLIGLVGIVVQFKVTSRGYDHKDGVKKVKSQHVELHKLKRQQSKDGNEVRLQKYQNLYRVRRCNGDVVAVSYLQSIQNHLSPEMQRIASITHLPPEPAILPPMSSTPEMTTTLLSNASTTVTTVGPVTHLDDDTIADV